MKKISTAEAKQSRNFSQAKLTIGLDLGDRSSWYCVLDERGEVLLEQKLGTSPKAMKEVFGGMPRSRIALETGMHSPWVSRVLSELGHEVIVAHARNVRLIGESRKKDDRLDAQTLARLARIDPQLLSPVKHRSAKAQADLTVIRARAGLAPTTRATTCGPPVMGERNSSSSKGFECADDNVFGDQFWCLKIRKEQTCRHRIQYADKLLGWHGQLFRWYDLQ
ncbi:MAG: transposase [Terriglobales bacterium]